MVQVGTGPLPEIETVERPGHAWWRRRSLCRMEGGEASVRVGSEFLTQGLDYFALLESRTGLETPGFPKMIR